MAVKIRRLATVVTAVLVGATALPGQALAADWNDVKVPISGSAFKWENYVRSHTSTSDIKFHLDERNSEVFSGQVALKYESNDRTFGSKAINRGAAYPIVSNWGGDSISIRGSVRRERQPDRLPLLLSF